MRYVSVHPRNYYEWILIKFNHVAPVRNPSNLYWKPLLRRKGSRKKDLGVEQQSCRWGRMENCSREWHVKAFQWSDMDRPHRRLEDTLQHCSWVVAHVQWSKCHVDYDVSENKLWIMIYLNPYFDEFNVKINSMTNDEHTANLFIKQQCWFSQQCVVHSLIVWWCNGFAFRSICQATMNVEQIRVLTDQIKEVFAFSSSS